MTPSIWLLIVWIGGETPISNGFWPTQVECLEKADAWYHASADPARSYGYCLKVPARAAVKKPAPIP